MDELPELRSDADVDALMGRLRSKLSPPSSGSARPPSADGPAPPASSDALADLVAAQDGLASTVVRALEAIAETLDELHRTAEGPPASGAPPSQRTRVRRTRAAVSRRAPAAKGRAR